MDGYIQMPDATKAMSNPHIVLDYRRYHDTFMDTYIHYPVLTQVVFTKYYCDMFTNLWKHWSVYKKSTRQICHWHDVHITYLYVSSNCISWNIHKAQHPNKNWATFQSFTEKISHVSYTAAHIWSPGQILQDTKFQTITLCLGINSSI